MCSNLIRGMDVSACLSCVNLCAGSRLVTGWSTVQGVPLAMYRIRKLYSRQGLTKGLVTLKVICYRLSIGSALLSVVALQRTVAATVGSRIDYWMYWKFDTTREWIFQLTVTHRLVLSVTVFTALLDVFQRSLPRPRPCRLVAMSHQALALLTDVPYCGWHSPLYRHVTDCRENTVSLLVFIRYADQLLTVP